MISKAVIPVAGFGTRMLPAAKAVPKELLPVLDRPTVQYVVEEAADAGVSDVLLISSREKKAIEDHFDRSPDLEARLAAGHKSHLLDSINRLMARVKVHSVRQAEQKGLGHAVLQAREHVGKEAFLCLLGDTLFAEGTEARRHEGTKGEEDKGTRGQGDKETTLPTAYRLPPTDSSLSLLPSSQLVRAYEQFQTPVIALEEVAAEKVSRYGIVGGTQVSPGVWRLDTLVEKPSPETAPSQLAIAARYVLTPDIFECLDETPAGKGGEIQLTDALKRLLARRPIHGVVVSARRHDIGNPVDWLKTNIMLASRDAELWKALVPLLRELMG